jgi:hypothetical protein
MIGQSQKRVLILLALLLVGAGWMVLRVARVRGPASPAEGETTLRLPPPTRAAVGKFNTLIEAEAGRVTAGEIAKLRDSLLDGTPESRAALEIALVSANPYDRLVAFRLSLELNGWQPRWREYALNDPFVLLRVEAADWLYLTERFTDWDAFLSLAVGKAGTDFDALRPAIRTFRWRELPYGADVVGVGRGIDRYLREGVRRSDAVAATVEKELLAVTGQQEFGSSLRVLHEANRPDYEAFLRRLVERSGDDSPIRYAAIWMLAQGFPRATTRDYFAQHRASYPGDPLSARVEQALASVTEQLNRGGDRLAWAEAQLNVAMQSGNRGEMGASLVAVVEEGLRSSGVADRQLLHDASRTMLTQALDYPARRRLADIKFLTVTSR